LQYIYIIIEIEVQIKQSTYFVYITFLRIYAAHDINIWFRMVGFLFAITLYIWYSTFDVLHQISLFLLIIKT